MASDRLPSWAWSFVAFRFSDGISHALIPLAALLVYDLPLWAVAATSAAMNLVGVPAASFWGRVVEHGRGRRRLAIMGFSTAAVGMGVMAAQPPFLAFLAGAMMWTAFGVATAPAASVLVLEGVPRRQWARATGQLSRHTGYAYLAGALLTTAFGLAGLLDLRIIMIVGAIIAVGAGVAALKTIQRAGPDYEAPVHRYDEAAVKQAQRRFERPVFLPARLRHRLRMSVETRRPPANVWLGAIVLLFAGSSGFFAAYPGLLVERTGLAAGMVLLAQLPSHVATPMTYPLAGRLGEARGELAVIRTGLLLRLGAIPALAAATLFGAIMGGWVLAILIPLHALVGVGFAFFQINTPCLLAQLHEPRRGAGVGAFHAATATGTLVGSTLAFLILLTLSVWWLAGATVLLLAAGTAMASRAAARMPE